MNNQIITIMVTKGNDAIKAPILSVRLAIFETRTMTNEVTRDLAI